MRTTRLVMFLFVLIGSREGAAKKPAPKPPETAAPASSAKGDSREAAAQKTLDSMKGVAEAEWRGHIAASSLAEPEFGLPEQLRSALRELGKAESESVGLLASAALDTGAGGETLTKLCGMPSHDVLTLALKQKREDRTAAVVSACKLKSPPDAADKGQLHFCSVLMSAVVTELLSSRGKPSEAEFTLARLIAQMGRLDYKP